jgi:hypothetical protein
MDQYQMNMEDAVPFSSDAPERIQLRVLQSAAGHHLHALSTCDHFSGRQTHAIQTVARVIW